MMKRVSPEVADQLAQIALEARAHAYAPYSRFRVGAALLTEGGAIIPGCNVENASFGLTLCAERNAITTAVAQGLRDFVAIAIASGSDPPAPPCGLCLQMMAEFCSDLDLILVNPSGAPPTRKKLSVLLSKPFRWKGVPGEPDRPSRAGRSRR